MGYSFMQTVKEVLHDRTLTIHEKMVMICLAQHADEHGKCFPSVRTIATQCSISRPTVIKALRSLEQKGWIKSEKQNGKVARYALNRSTTLTGQRDLPVNQIDHQPVNHVDHRSTTFTGQPDLPVNDVDHTGKPDLPVSKQPVNDVYRTGQRGLPELEEKKKDIYAAAADIYKTSHTVEDPQEQQHQQQEANIFTTFERAYGRIPTPFQVEVFSSFIEDGLPEALVCRAIEKAAMDNKGPRYAEAICRDWLAKGIRTVEEAEREEREWRAQQQKVVPLNRQQQKQDLDWTPPYWREYVPKDEPKPKFDILKLDVDKLPLLNAKQRAHLKKLQEEERKRRAQAAMKDAANGSA